MVTGSVARPVNDALKVPHEKAAFIVHTTSTPWCVLFPFSGWLAAMAGYLVTGGVPEDQSVSVLFQSLFMNFYCILAILLVLVLALTQKDLDQWRRQKPEQQQPANWMIRSTKGGLRYF